MEVAIETIDRWYDYIKLGEKLSRQGWAFRGQLDASWPITSTISRYLAQYVPEEKWAEREQRAIKVFQRKAHYFLADPSTLKDTLRCLALMQHHGAPTRLIDFSKSPFVAAYFALEKATADSAVYALNTPQLWHAAAPKGFPKLDRKSIDPRSVDNFKNYFFSNKYPIIWPGEPYYMDKRAVSQSGTFVLPGMLGKTVNEILEQYNSKEPLLIKIILSKELRSEGMEGLYRMNITNATLFPDLDGLAKSMAGELEMVWAGHIPNS